MHLKGHLKAHLKGHTLSFLQFTSRISQLPLRQEPVSLRKSPESETNQRVMQRLRHTTGKIAGENLAARRF